MPKIFFKYFLIAIAAVLVVGFFITFEGYKPKPPQDENILPQEQIDSIKQAGQNPENLEILGDVDMPKQTFDPTKLHIEDTKIGGGQEVKSGDTVEVHYEGKLLDGTLFDSSHLHQSTFIFEVGKGEVIKGWDEGLIGMKIGGKRKLTIPPSLGYGEHGVPGTIPPNSVLIFDIELIDIK